ncbi:MAG: hypothetical protein ACREJ2_05125 [Planctomycetota bacterium]
MSNQGPATPPPEPSGNRKSLGILTELRKSLCQRMAQFVLTNERQLRAEITGRDTFNLMLGQMDELFLSKLGVLDRALYEVNRMEAPQASAEQTTHFEVIEVRSAREELPQKIANLLAEHAEKSLLQLLPLRTTPEEAELLAVFSYTTTESGRSSDS